MGKNFKIAVYDSGLGGIPTLNALRERMPCEEYFYLADNANMPYGDKDATELLTIAAGNIRLLESCAKIKMLVFACNTLTAATIKEIRAGFPGIIIIGTEPNIKQAVKGLRGEEKALVLVTASTKKTINFGEKFPNRKQYDVLALPWLASAIENELPASILRARLNRDLFPVRGRYKSLVLGCTHYFYAREHLMEIMGGIPIFESVDGVTRQAEKKLAQEDLITVRAKKGSLTFLFTKSDPEIYKKYTKYVK